MYNYAQEMKKNTGKYKRNTKNMNKYKKGRKNMNKKNEELTKKLAEEIEKKKKPVIVEKLTLDDGEMYLGELPDKDKYQVLIRHLHSIDTHICQGANSSALLLSNIFLVLKEMAKKQGIDVKNIVDKQ